LRKHENSRFKFQARIPLSSGDIRSQNWLREIWWKIEPEKNSPQYGANRIFPTKFSPIQTKFGTALEDYEDHKISKISE